MGRSLTYHVKDSLERSCSKTCFVRDDASMSNIFEFAKAQSTVISSI